MIVALQKLMVVEKGLEMKANNKLRLKFSPKVAFSSLKTLSRITLELLLVLELDSVC